VKKLFHVQYAQPASLEICLLCVQRHEAVVTGGTLPSQKNVSTAT
jgi:hypothetical protein